MATLMTDKPKKLWINPNLSDEAKTLLDNLEITDGANCNNCYGSGRHIYVDTDGKMKDMACMACQGSGQQNSYNPK